MFYWKEHFFEANINKKVQPQLVVKWRSCSSTMTTDTAQDKTTHRVHTDDGGDEERRSFDFLSNSIISEYCPPAASTFHDERPQSKCTTYYDSCNLGKNHGHILKTGFSFDHASMCKVPVILTQIENITGRSEKYKPFESQRSEQSCSEREGKCSRLVLLLFGIMDNVLSVAEGSGDKRFSIVPLRLFRWSNSDTVGVMHNLLNLRFISDYGLFYHDKYKKDNQGITFQILFGHCSKGPDVSIQSTVINEIGDCDPRKSDIHVMDVLNSFLNRMILAVICWTNANALTKCEALLFYSLYNSKYMVKRVKLDSLFPSQFEQIAEKISIFSLSTRNTPPCIKSSSLVMLTSTKYAIRFSNGEMTHCVSLCERSHIYQNVEDLTEVKLKAIDCSCGNELKAVLHIKDICLLVDWTTEKSRLLHTERVHMLGRCENGSLSTLLKTQGGQDLAESTILNINISEIKRTGDIDSDEIQNTEANDFFHSSHSSINSQETKRNNDETEREMNDATKNVLNGLVLHEKGCQIDVTDMEQSLRSKETFIRQTLNHFSSDLEDDGKKHLNLMQTELPPLVPVTAHSDIWHGCLGKNITAQRQRHWRIGRIWKRTIDKSLVCGVDLVKLSQSDNLHDIYLILVPVNPCRNRTQSKSLLVHQTASNSLSSSFSSSLNSLPSLATSTEPSSPPRKRSCQSESILHRNKCDSSHSTKSPLSLKVTAALNTEGFWGCENIVVQVYLTYSALTSQDRQEVARECHKVNCGTVSVSQREKLEESFNLKALVKNCREKDFFDVDDIAALDCVQTNLDLLASSVLNPVISLLEKVKSHPSITFLSRFDQYIYSTDHHRLQFCRLKWLKQLDTCNAVIRIFSRTQDDLLLFVEFLNSISPTDISFQLHEKMNESKLKSMKFVEKLLCEKIEQTICDINKKIENIAVAVEIPHVDTNNDDVEIITDVPSPTFHTSIQKTENKSVKGEKKLEPHYPSTSGIATLTELKSSEKDKKTSAAISVLDDDLNQFDFGNGFASKAEIEGKGKKGLGTKKGSKSKLTTRKK